MHLRYTCAWLICSCALANATCDFFKSRSGDALASPATNSMPAPRPSSATAAPPALLPGAPDVASLVARVRPAVVNITVTAETKLSGALASPFPFDPFDFFFGQQTPSGRPPGDRTLRQHALGSGFIIDAQGHVITNAHVVANAKTVRVRLLDEREFNATVRGRDSKLDVAVLDLADAKELPSVPLGSSSAMRVGDYIVAIGNPFGLGDTVTMGIISAKSRAIGAGPYDDFIQTDAAINPGNSGGPLINISGEVVGISTAINPNGQGIGFAIPIDDVKEILPQLLTKGHVSRGHLGVSVQMMDATTAKALGLDGRHGALIAEVAPSGPAARAGLQSGDVILSVGQTEIRDSRELPRVIAVHPPGSKVNVKVQRDRRDLSFEITLGELKDDAAPSMPPAVEGSGTSGRTLGIDLAESQAGPMVARIEPGSASEGQLQSGDVILEVNKARVHRVDEVTRRIADAPHDRPMLLKIRRGDQEQFVGIERK